MDTREVYAVTFQPLAHFVNHRIEAAEKIVRALFDRYFAEQVGNPPVVIRESLFPRDAQPQRTPVTEVIQPNRICQAADSKEADERL